MPKIVDRSSICVNYADIETLANEGVCSRAPNPVRATGYYGDFSICHLHTQRMRGVAINKPNMIVSSLSVAFLSHLGCVQNVHPLPCSR